MARRRAVAAAGSTGADQRISLMEPSAHAMEPGGSTLVCRDKDRNEENTDLDPSRTRHTDLSLIRYHEQKTIVRITQSNS